MIASIEASTGNGWAKRLQIQTNNHANEISSYETLNGGISWEPFTIYGGSRQSATMSDKVRQIGMYRNRTNEGYILRSVYNKTDIQSDNQNDIRIVDLHIDMDGLSLYVSEDNGATWTHKWTK